MTSTRPETGIGYRFVVPGNPVPWQRTNYGRGGRSSGPATFTTKPETRQYQELVQFHARLAKVRQLHGPLALTVRFFRRNAQRCDWDNLTKSVQDALNYLAWVDDSQIVRADVTKGIDAKNPRTEIEIAEAE